MKDSVSSRQDSSVFALLAGLSAVWMACSIFIPYGFPWMGLAWVGLAISAALWVSIRSTRLTTVAQLLREVEAEPIRAVAGLAAHPGAKSGRLAARPWVYLACLSLWPACLSAATPDAAANLSACKNNWSSCERSRLTLTEMTEVTLAARSRNLASCREGLSRCDEKKLSRAEAIARGEAAARTRNVLACQEGRDNCDHSLLNPSEAEAVTSAERLRNDRSCLESRGDCDRTRVSPSEVASVPPEAR